MLRMLIRPRFLRMPIPEGYIQSRALPPAVMLFVLLMAGLMASAPTARAQNDGAILLFSDPDYTSCSVIDVADQEYTVYIVHVDDSGVIASQFRVRNEAGLTYVREQILWTVLGNTQSGMTVLYDNECVSGEILVGTVGYAGTGTSSSCSYLSIAPFGFGVNEVEATTCEPEPEKIIPFPGRLFVNPDPSCPCELVVPVEETSWGRIKALYE